MTLCISLSPLCPHSPPLGLLCRSVFEPPQPHVPRPLLHHQNHQLLKRLLKPGQQLQLEHRFLHGSLRRLLQPLRVRLPQRGTGQQRAVLRLSDGQQRHDRRFVRHPQVRPRGQHHGVRRHAPQRRRRGGSQTEKWVPIVHGEQPLQRVQRLPALPRLKT